MTDAARYQRDPFQPTTADVAADLDRLSDSWVLALLGDMPDDWPRPDEGRTRGAVHLVADLLAADAAELDRPPLPTLPEGPLCAHCGLAPVAVHVTRRWGRTWLDVCSRCRAAVIRTGRLPSKRANERHRRRLGYP